MDHNEFKYHFEEYLKEYVGELKARLFNLEGYKTQAEYDELTAKITELEQANEKLKADCVSIPDLNEQIANLEKDKINLEDKIEMLEGQHKSDIEKVDQYRMDAKKYIAEIEQFKEKQEELEQKIESLKEELNETHESLKTASAEAISNLSKYKKEKERADQLSKNVKSK